MRTILIIILVFSLFASCRPTRKIQTAITKIDTVMTVPPPETNKEDTVAIIRDNINKLKAQSLDFTTFSAKVDVDYEGADAKKEKANATVRMYKDSLIWISVTGLFGIEGLRAYITKDSVKMINKLDKLYTGRSVAYIQEMTGLPLDLPSIQDLIIGNPIFLDSNIVSYIKGGNTVSLLSMGRWFKNLVTLNEGTLVHSKLDDEDVSRNRTCDLSYDDYEDKKGVKFSSKRRITVSEKSKLDIKLDFRSYNFNETLSFPFSIPKNYHWN